MATITLSWIPDLTTSVGVPRLAAIEAPGGCNISLPGDHERQMAVLRATLQALAEMSTPGSVRQIPFEWQEPAEKLNIHPPQPPPISQYLVRHLWELPRFLRRDPPDQL